ncbi:MAG: NAD(P)/FAD-dependent oxidoreductase [candidate division KSB1 bacterium]|nr:NAD(P)/FAD-dependent oxidoreductase [candidate division KSB1 bacterium]MDZ7333997.1 NAD(P)/FAD-dependent oxidoreductase [candidate division KSB1 bacterium]MDZ7357963.1 NAD(P)/FAD-dependent oxidoreductase [candidate division KSB1 bacterium]MDZ7375248.1 NAD(P)/FAD-dependent oxidoreductase [candidate division KSB1 bacterium]MDZ7399982.1 NAD(P)/FAD-dependent oxidoreductase [candidate division KSB1 bacterium]
MIDDYDIVVVGAGPAGSTAARVASEHGAKVLVLEKDREIGIPVRCGEAVGDKGLRRVLEPRPEWIANAIEAVRLIAPDETVVTVHHDDIGYILDRKRFDYDLAMMAAQRGAKIVTKAYVYGLIIENGTVKGVKVLHLGNHYQIRAKVVIGADGVESRVGRWAGLKTAVRLKDMESCVQMTVSNITLDRRYCDFYFATTVAPGGYLWVFPKNDHLANIGLGVSGEFAAKKAPLFYLREFIDRKFPKAAILTTVAGGVPCAPFMDKIVTSGLMLVGDAAHQANPLTGGGIVQSIIAAEIAGRVAAMACKENDCSETRLQEYSKAWDKENGSNHRRAYRLKEAVYKLTDSDLNRTAAAIAQKPPEKQTILNIFTTALIQHPKLLPDIVKLFMA